MVSFLKELAKKFTADGVSDAAGALAFFVMLALFPFIIGLVTLASLLVDPAMLEGLIQELQEVAPPEVTAIVGGQLRGVVETGTSGLLTASVLGAYLAASKGTRALIRALNRVNEVYETRPWWMVRGLALVTTIFIAIVFLVAALLMVALPPVARAVAPPLAPLITWLRLPVAGLIAILCWELINRFLPDVKRRFRWISPGSVVAVVVWLAASQGFAIYVANFGKYEATYGALAGVVILLFWLWLSAIALLLGTEVNLLLEQRKREGRDDREDHRPAD